MDRGLIRTGLFRFVLWEHIDRYEREGWMVIQNDLGPVHRVWAVLMWRCDCGGSSRESTGSL